MLEFTAEDHSYRLNGVSLPSVTQCTGLLCDYGNIPPAVLQAACDFGTNVHRATELFDLDDLDEDALSPALAPWLDGWKRFKNESGFLVRDIESRVYSKTYGYAGTLDRVGVLNGKLVIIDIKTPTVVNPSTGPQTAAYQHAVEEMNKEKIKGRYALQLKGDGTYRLIPYADKNDFNVFLGCLNVINFRRKHHGK